MIRLGYAGVVVAVLLGLSSAAPLPKDAPKELYFPTTKGAKLVYKTGDAEEVEVITSVELKDGETIVTVCRELEGGKEAPYCKLSASADGLRLLEAGNGAKYDPPLLVLRAPAKAGEKWDVDSSLRGGEVKGSRTVVGMEKVVVPAGTFDAVKVEAAYTNGGEQRQGTYWYVQGIGPVKSINGDRTRILKSFTPGKP